jgi:flagellar protein FliO/FliZ
VNKKLNSFLLGAILSASLFCGHASGAADAASAEVAPVKVEKIRSFREGDVFTTELATTTSWRGGEAQATFSGDAIQVDLSNASLAKAQSKQLIKVEDRFFKSAYFTQLDASTVRVRLALKPGFRGGEFESNLKIRRDGSSILLEVTGDPVGALAERTGAKKAKAESKSETRSLAITDSSDENPDPVGAKLVAGAPSANAVDASGKSINSAQSGSDESAPIGASASTKTAATEAARGAASASGTLPKVDTSKLPEDQVPFVMNEKDSKKSAGSPLQKLVITLTVLACALGAAVYGLKRWSAKNAKNSVNTKIKILTQHHLGPKKSLAIVRVAGESILVGITDHNITMLKSLALLDEDVPEVETEPSEPREARSFGRALAQSMKSGLSGSRAAATPAPTDSGASEEDDFALRGISEIRDVVSSRLKNMRPL